MLKKKSQTTQDWLPDYFAKTTSEIDFEYLRNKGIKAMMFDLDHTILVHGSTDVETNISKALDSSGMKVYIATNRRESNGLNDIKKSISAQGIMFARSVSIAKPRKEYYKLAIEMTGVKPEEVAMVGDRLVQDIWGANRAGITTVMVSKFGHIRWYDQILTIPDRIMPKLFKGHYRTISD